MVTNSVFKRAEYEQPDSRVFIVKLYGFLCQSNTDPSNLDDPENPGEDIPWN